MTIEQQRLDYPLTADSLVLDVGAYQGQFTRDVIYRFGCRVWAFEPVRASYEHAKVALALGPSSMATTRVRLFHAALGPTHGTAVMSVRNDSSSLHLPSETTEAVFLASVGAVFRSLSAEGLETVDLMKVNIEGAEYDLLDAMLDLGLLARVRYLQVQFHYYGAGEAGPVARRDAIRMRLAKTHEEQWCEPFVWESWGRR